MAPVARIIISANRPITHRAFTLRLESRIGWKYMIVSRCDLCSEMQLKKIVTVFLTVETKNVPRALCCLHLSEACFFLFLLGSPEKISCVQFGQGPISGYSVSSPSRARLSRSLTHPLTHTHTHTGERVSTRCPSYQKLT